MEKVSRNILLKQVREERGWTQRRLADELGVSEQTVRTWERGTRSPLLEHRTRLSEIFGRTPEQLGLSPLNDTEPSPHNEVSPLLSDLAVASSPTTESIERDNYFSIVPHAPARPVFHQIDQNRQRMLTRVRSRWITGMLENSLYHETLIVLGLQEHPDAVANPWHLTVQESNLPSRPLPVGTRITDVYDDVNGELLILGEPGAGKTTLLLELAQELLDRAEADETHPIPVVFNLASWTERFHASLASWIVEELTTKYQVPHALGRKWIETNTLLLLLDGLDEVEQSRRSACIEAINAYHESHHLASIVVCSREIEYMAQAKRIALQRAVMVQPLTTEQIDEYLSSAGKEMEAIRSTLRDDLELRELVETPLMLSVFTLAYHGRSGEELRTHVSSEARRKQVFATYVQRMLVRRTAETRYTPQETMRYLAWLAHDMRAHSQTEFFIERMQPDCLQDNLSSYRHYRVTVIRVVFGIATFVGAGILASFRGDMYPSQPGLFYWVGGGVGNSVLGWMAPGLGGELKGATCLGLIQAIVTVIVTILGDRRELPLVTGKALQRGLFSTLRYSVLVGVIVAIFASLVFIWADGWSYGLFQGGR